MLIINAIDNRKLLEHIFATTFSTTHLTETSSPYGLLENIVGVFCWHKSPCISRNGLAAIIHKDIEIFTSKQKKKREAILVCVPRVVGSPTMWRCSRIFQRVISSEKNNYLSQSCNLAFDLQSCRSMVFVLSNWCLECQKHNYLYLLFSHNLTSHCMTTSIPWEECYYKMHVESITDNITRNISYII